MNSWHRSENIKSLACMLCLLWLLLLSSTIYAAGSVERASREYLCSWASLASYHDRIGQLARNELAERGWQFVPYQNQSGQTVPKAYIARNGPDSHGTTSYLITMTGTETTGDIKTDLRVSMVGFGGTSVPAFIKTAQNHNLTAADPQVHKGFEQYVRDSFFNADKKGRILGEDLSLYLRTHGQDRLILTGHSLGGAAATLMAARLLDMGIPATQMDVVTFGAPAVGNKAFIERYGPQLPLDRISISGDPVKTVLQLLPNGYVQFANQTKWKQTSSSQRFEHDMVVYVDAALRNYYDVAGLDSESRPLPAAMASRTEKIPRVYIAPFTFTLDDHLSGDLPYMAASQHDTLYVKLAAAVFASGRRQDLLSTLAEARKAGCDYILMDNFVGKRIADEEYLFRMTLQEELYDIQGRLVYAQEANTNTAEMTPIEALLYDQLMIQAHRKQILNNKK